MPVTTRIFRFGAVLRRLRKERGYTIEAAAQRGGVTANYLGDIERGQREVIARILAGLLQVS
jgi:transcriptional regulator with XRE-family HTH domain